MKQYKKVLFVALFCATLNQGFSLLDPQIFRMIIDRYATQIGHLSQGEFVHGVIILILASMGVAFVSRVAKNFQDYFVSVITQNVGTKLYAQSVAHSFSLPYAAFEDQQSGALLQKLQKARADSQAFVTSAVNIIYLSVVGVLIVLVYAFYVHWMIGLAYFFVIPVLGFITFTIGRRIKAAQKAIVKESAELAGTTTETIRNVELVKSLGLEEQEVRRLNGVSEKILDLELKKVRLVRKLSFVQGTSVNAMRSIILFLMLYLLMQNSISLGELFTLLFYSFAIFNPLGELGNVSAQYQEAKASMEQLEEVFETPQEVKPAHPAVIQSINEIQFQGVSFTYASADEASVHNVDLMIRGGETVAFVGPSGSGKTTLIKLLVGLYQSSEGIFSINGINARTIDFDSVRKKIGFVSQETQLFAGTLRDNLLFVQPSARDTECEGALRLASAGSILERGGKGLDTKIGEGGIKLSGGERQRLAIARALLRKPELIIFDEATSSLDSITEKAITETILDIEKAHSSLITILVAHRLSTVMHAKRIYVLEKGRLVEVGMHDELLRMQGLYAALWREQAGEEK